MSQILESAAYIMYRNGVEYPEKPRFFLPDGDSWKTILWKDYLASTAKIAHWLKEFGLEADDKVSVYAGTCVEWAYCALASQAARGVLVPIYHSSTAEQVQYILDHSDTKVVFAQKCFLPVLQSIYKNLPDLKCIVLMDGDFEEGQQESFGSVQTLNLCAVMQAGSEHLSEDFSSYKDLVAQVREEDVANMIYTSGTTGQPKGVELTHKNVILNGEDWLDVLGSAIPEERVDLLWLPLSHIFGWGEIGLGNTLLFETYFSDPKSVLPQMPELKPTIFMSVPAYWEKLYLQASSDSSLSHEQHLQKLKDLTGGKLQFCLSGGAGLKKEVKEFYLEAGMLLIEGYGLTECSPTLTMNSKESFNFDTVGKPFPKVEIKLADDGEILAKGPNVYKGYYKNREATAETFDEDGWFHTGDLGAFTKDGFLKIIGRKKDILVTAGGKNVSPQLIEQRFLDNPLVEYVVLYGNEKKYLVSMITLHHDQMKKWAEENGVEFKSSELAGNPKLISKVQESVNQVNSQLASYETIKKFFIHPGHLSIEKGHLTSSLKIRRMAIHKEFQEQYEALYN